MSYSRYHETLIDRMDKPCDSGRRLVVTVTRICPAVLSSKIAVYPKRTARDERRDKKIIVL